MFTVKISKSDFKNPGRWAELARLLDLPDGRMEAIVMRMPGLLPVEPATKIETHGKEPEEWLIAESLDGEREWVIHNREPRFMAEIVDDEEDTFNPPFEYQLKNGQWLCNFNWLEPPPEDLTILCNEAETAIEIYDENLGVG